MAARKTPDPEQEFDMLMWTLRANKPFREAFERWIAGDAQAVMLPAGMSFSAAAIDRAARKWPAEAAWYKAADEKERFLNTPFPLPIVHSDFTFTVKDIERDIEEARAYRREEDQKAHKARLRAQKKQKAREQQERAILAATAREDAEAANLAEENARRRKEALEKWPLFQQSPHWTVIQVILATLSCLVPIDLIQPGPMNELLVWGIGGGYAVSGLLLGLWWRFCMEEWNELGPVERWFLLAFSVLIWPLVPILTFMVYHDAKRQVAEEVQ